MKERWREIESDVGRERVGRKIVGEMVEKMGKIVG